MDGNTVSSHSRTPFPSQSTTLKMMEDNQDNRAPDENDFVVVNTTLPSLPLPRNAERADVVTERLVLRALRAEDLNAIHVLRTQPEVMVWTTTGRGDKDIAETQAKLDLSLPPNDVETFNCAICWRETGEVIGVGGSHRFKGAYGWPELGYMIRKEFWGRGLATEMVKAFLDAYVKLPRAPAQLRVDRRSVVATTAGQQQQEPVEAREVLVALVETSNERSHGVLMKCGLERFNEFAEPDLRDTSKTLGIVAYRLMVARSGV
ncbi:hypothetical protein RB595_003259 [Gaeumannomyces hyphopodioides]